MISMSRIVEIRRLLGQGFSQRRVAALVGASRALVGSVANGTRTTAVADDAPGMPVRCPTCGGLVFAPCQLCRVRRIVGKEAHYARLHRLRARQQALRRVVLELYRQSVEREKHERDDAARLRAAVQASRRDCL